MLQYLSKIAFTFTVSLATVALVYALGYYGYLPMPKPTAEERIADFYATENAVHVSPHSVRKDIRQVPQ